MSAKLFTMPSRIDLDQPTFDDFHGKKGFQKYSDSIWYCIHEIIEKDCSMLGRYGEAYDKNLISNLNAMRHVISSFRRHGMIAVNEPVQKSISQMMRNIN